MARTVKIAIAIGAALPIVFGVGSRASANKGSISSYNQPKQSPSLSVGRRLFLTGVASKALCLIGCAVPASRRPIQLPEPTWAISLGKGPHSNGTSSAAERATSVDGSFKEQFEKTLRAPLNTRINIPDPSVDLGGYKNAHRANAYRSRLRHTIFAAANGNTAEREAVHRLGERGVSLIVEAVNEGTAVRGLLPGRSSPEFPIRSAEAYSAYGVVGSKPAHGYSTHYNLLSLLGEMPSPSVPFYLMREVEHGSFGTHALSILARNFPAHLRDYVEMKSNNPPTRSDPSYYSYDVTLRHASQYVAKNNVSASVVSPGSALITPGLGRPARVYKPGDTVDLDYGFTAVVVDINKEKVLFGPLVSSTVQFKKSD